MQRILCLHGYTQNSDVFRARTAILRKDLASIAELVYIDAPHIVPASENKISNSDVNAGKQGWCFRSKLLILLDSTQRSWWTDDQGLAGFQEAISFIKGCWDENGPFDGIFGFSQGATMAAIMGSELSFLHAAKNLRFPPPRYVIAVSGFLPTRAGNDSADVWFPHIISKRFMSLECRMLGCDQKGPMN
ncbi:serine hydrolase FSH [Chytridium lagenaria]|nr:serine hydrolase FSH [Chytridium lagenaria]